MKKKNLIIFFATLILSVVFLGYGLADTSQKEKLNNENTKKDLQAACLAAIGEISLEDLSLDSETLDQMVRHFDEIARDHCIVIGYTDGFFVLENDGGTEFTSWDYDFGNGTIRFYQDDRMVVSFDDGTYIDADRIDLYDNLSALDKLEGLDFLESDETCNEVKWNFMNDTVEKKLRDTLADEKFTANWQDIFKNPFVIAFAPENREETIVAASLDGSDLYFKGDH